jgi:thioredoxin-like negative regulator of GroEL
LVLLYVALVPFGSNLNYDGSTHTKTNNTTVAVSKTSNVTANATKNATAKATAKATAAPQKQVFKIYFFEQDNCPYCTQMYPLITSWAADPTNHAKFGDLVIINISNDQSLNTKYNIRGVPVTLVTDMNGKELTRFTGAFDISELTAWCNSH